MITNWNILWIQCGFKISSIPSVHKTSEHLGRNEEEELVYYRLRKGERPQQIYVYSKERIEWQSQRSSHVWANFGHRNGHVLYFTQSSSSARKHEDNKFSTLLRGSGEESLISVSPYLYIGLWWIYFVVRYIRLGVCLGRAANWRCREFQ